MPLIWSRSSRGRPVGARLAENMLATIFDLFAKSATSDQQRLRHRLVSELRELATDVGGSAQTEFWSQTCCELAACAETGDPMYFMRWPPIAATMVQGTTAYAIEAYRLLQCSPAWQSVWKQALRHKQYGHPPPFLRNLSTNAVTVQHALHLETFLRRTGQSLIDAECIVELGGGYGSLCRLVHRLGFSGQYLIFDQPPILALQRYYLGLHEIAAEYASGPMSAVILCQEIDDIMARVKALRPASTTLISTWALSEMPLHVREQAEALLAIAAVDRAILAYQAQFAGIDNMEYFGRLAERAGYPWAWQHFEMDFCPNNYYLLGMKHL